jgi:hypothetical protein
VTGFDSQPASSADRYRLPHSLSRPMPSQGRSARHRHHDRPPARLTYYADARYAAREFVRCGS